MKNIIKGSLISVATCAVLLSLQGCGSDRAGVSVAKARSLGYLSIPGNGRNVTPTDSDGDGIDDEDEINGYRNVCGTLIHTDPHKWSSDDVGKTTDGLSDGYEKTHSYTHDGKTECTNPNLLDTDGDGIKDGDEVLGYNTPFDSKTKTNPTDNDSDNDGLTDGEEKVGKVIIINDINITAKTNPNNPDSDGDMLSDGVELENAIQTNPRDIDTDGDGVTDGIEVCGTKGTDNTHTNGYGSGQINAIDVIGLNISISNDGTTSYNDKLDTLINHYGGNTDCNSPADTNNDTVGKIDALDPTNDSDGDERPNNKEKAKGKDPLDFGSKYAWITETAKGQDMIAKGFVYIPKANGMDGFWMSKYEAKYKNNHAVGVVFDNTVDVISYNANSNLNDDKIDANTRLDNYKNDNTNYSEYYMPTQKKYQNLFLLKNGTFDGNGCLTIENKNSDANIPRSYNALVCELKQNDELVKNLVNSNHYIDGNNAQQFGSSRHSISFRATTTTIPELSYLP